MLTTVTQELTEITARAGYALALIEERRSEQPLRRGGWSCKQILGHLIDSASNNHQRFVRASMAGELTFPDYNPDLFVAMQSPQTAPWHTLIDLWKAYNRYLVHVITRIPDDRLGTLCRIGEAGPITLEFLAADYLVHLKHHLKQMGVA